MFLRLPRTYWLIWLGALINRLGGFVFSFLALYLTEARHLSAVDAGIAVSLYGLGSAAAAGFGGFLADTKGRRFGLLFGTLTGATMILLLYNAEGLWTVRIVAFFTGFFADSYRPALNAAVADIVEPADRARAFSILYWAINLGFAIAAASAGWLAKAGYHLLFYIDAATTITFAGLVFAFLPETKPASTTHAAPIAWWRPFADPRFLPFALAQFTVVLVFTQGHVSLPLAMRAHGIGSELFGTLIAMNGVLIIVLQPFTNRIVTKLSDAHLLGLGALFTGLGFGFNAIANTVPLYLVGILLWTIGELGFSAAAPAFIARVSPPEARGVYQGAHHMLWGASFTLAPLIGTFVMERISPNALWIGCLVACVGAAIAHINFVSRATVD